MGYRWRERMEKYIEGTESGLCCGLHCDGCVFTCPDRRCILNYTEFGLVDAKARIFLFRHILTTVQNFDDNDEIRDRLAEMLGAEAREKFLGKAEEKAPRYTAHNHCEKVRIDGGGGHRYAILRSGVAIAWFLHEDTRDRVLEFLNKETYTIKTEDIHLD